MNGTFFSDDAVLIDGEPTYETEHPIFEIGANGHQDIMLHVSDTVLNSGYNTLAAKKNGFNLSNWFLHHNGRALTRGDALVGWANKQINSNGDPGDHIDLSVFLSDEAFSFQEDRMVIDHTARLVFKDPTDDNSLISDFSLIDINFDMDIKS